jgi:hypothetical protein
LTIVDYGTITQSGTYSTANTGDTVTAVFSGPIVALANVSGITSTFNLTSTAGANTTVNEGVGVGVTFNLTADGGSFTTQGLLGAIGLNNTTIENHGTYTVDAAFISALSGGTVTFGPGSGNLFHITDTAGLSVLSASPVISGFSNTSNDTILDDDIKTSGLFAYQISNNIFTGNQDVTFYSGSALLPIPEGTLTFAAGTFAVTGTFTDATTGPLHVDLTSASLEFTRCFLTGTHILTPKGQVNVEDLKLGDEVVAADGSIQPIRWVGINTVSSRFADPLRFMPIRIRSGALGNGLPLRDLLVSPDHAMFFEGVLIQAAAMVNGLSIVREKNMPETFIYYHIEIQNHALILAEGAPSESFVDNADRMAFDNWDEYLSLYGEDIPISEMDYPRAQSARQIPGPIRARLDECANRLFGLQAARVA